MSKDVYMIHCPKTGEPIAFGDASLEDEVRKAFGLPTYAEEVQMAAQLAAEAEEQASVEVEVPSVTASAANGPKIL